MNILGINCSVEKGLGRIAIVVLNSENEAYSFVYKSPSVFSFKNNSAEILNWHRDNVISLVSQFAITAIVVKKTELSAFHGKPKKHDIFKLYLEGVFLSLAGGLGISNQHFYKNEIQSILSEPSIFDQNISDICSKYGITNQLDLTKSTDTGVIKDSLLSVISLKTKLNP